MSVTKPRSRVVYFRVSEEEMERLQQLCNHQGARSLSDFARSAILEVFQRGERSVEDQVLAELADLGKGIKHLNRRLDDLTRISMQDGPSILKPDISVD